MTARDDARAALARWDADPAVNRDYTVSVGDSVADALRALLDEPVGADHVHEYRLSYACACGEHAQGETFETVRKRHARTARAPHQHEKWQLQESAKGGMYCAACGEDVPS